MKIYACSDLHVSPTHFSDRARAFLEEATQESDLTLFCGDIYEGSWHPLEESFESDNGQELLGLIQGQPEAVVLLGNHDWTLDQYLVDSKHPVVKNYSFNADGKRYYATHGWIEYDVALSLLAPIYRWLFPLLPILTKCWTRKRSPRTLKLKALKSGGRSDFYWRHVRDMSNQAIFQAIDKGWIPIWGHSHRRHIDAYEKWLTINCGDFSEDDIGGVVIEDGVAREWISA
jgi:UDP-2,3-diacylglucosamine pyrophosphatase LpxH